MHGRGCKTKKIARSITCREPTIRGYLKVEPNKISAVTY